MKVPENDPINASTLLLHSLLDEIPKVQTFKGKWALITAKLAHLQTQLTDFVDFPNSVFNPLCLDLLNSVSDSLNEGLLLARRCQTPNFADGKLRTQSDVDSILAKLDRHVRDSEILIKSGVLQDDVAPSGSAASSSKREAVRAESRNLITRLQIGSSDSKHSAMDSLLSLLLEDDKNVMIAVAQGVVPVLVRLLDSPSLEMKEKSVAAISRVSMVESSKHVLIAEGLLLLNHLLRVLESGSGFSKEKACIALQALSFSKENARAIGSRGGISSLLEICQDGTPGSQAFAAGVLRNLAQFEEIRENFIEENAVSVLRALASSGTLLAQENSIGCLCNLAKDDENLKLSIVKEGGIECLRNFWDSAPPVQTLEVAVNLLAHLASNQAIAEALVYEDFITKLVEVLNCGVLGVRIAAAKAVHSLSYNTKTRKEIGESGLTSPLIKMLDGKAAEEKEAAAKALSHVLQYAGNRRIFRKDEKGIISTVLLLDPKVPNVDKKYPISILALLVCSKKCRKQMISAGAAFHLKKLVEVDVEGSKKLLDSLGRGKIWGVFARP